MGHAGCERYMVWGMRDVAACGAGLKGVVKATSGLGNGYGYGWATASWQWLRLGTTVS